MPSFVSFYRSFDRFMYFFMDMASIMIEILFENINPKNAD